MKRMLGVLILSVFAVSAGADPILIVFEEEARHIDLVLTTRAHIRQLGGHVRAVIGLAGIVADVARADVEELAAIEGVRVFDSAVVAPAGDEETALALSVWNRLLEPPPLRTAMAPPAELLTDDVIEEVSEADYRLHLTELRQTLPARLQRSNSIGCGSNGAPVVATSLYLAGDVAVGVFFRPGTTAWTPATTASAFADVVKAIDEYTVIEPEARLTFTYVKEVDGSGNPLPKPPNDRIYANDLRNTYCTDWAFVVDMRDGASFPPQANYFGPTISMDWKYGWFHDVLRHEVGHIFGAGDAYPPWSPSPRYGYLRGAHANACGQGGAYFGGKGECLADLMNGWDPTYGYNSRISPSTAAQLGWLAPGGEGLLEVLDTKPLINASTVAYAINAATSAVTFNGIAFDRPRLNDNPSGVSVSINRITAVQYRIGDAPWQDAVAADGVFDAGTEHFAFTTPPLPKGTYAVAIQALNTIGAVTPVAYSQQLVVANSAVTNTRPFAGLILTRERAKAGTPFAGYGSTSRDLEPGKLQYSWKWDSTWTPFSATPVSTHTYTTPGTYAVQLRVRDQGGLVHLVSKNVTVTAADTPPVAKLRAVFENQHTTGATYTVFLTSAGSRDAESSFGQLTVQWDLDCDGWDAGPAPAKSKTLTLTNVNYPKSDRRCVRMRVFDPAQNASNVVTQHVWTVPYNHAPVVTAVNFSPSGSAFTMSVTAADPDSATTWDGVLEYRFDFEGDGIWDTPFQSGFSTTVKAADRYTVRVEVRDRFNARTVWIWNPCAPLHC